MIEIWKDIPGYEGHYQVSNLGRIKSFKRNKEYIMKYYKDKDGYLRIILYINSKPKYYTIHRLLMLTFKQDEYFAGAQVNHRNGKKDDNTLENLEWCTGSQNIQHADNTGLRKMPKGSNHHGSKLNDKIIHIIRIAISNKYFKQNELAKIFGVDNMTINKIVHNKAWSHV